MTCGAQGSLLLALIAVFLFGASCVPDPAEVHEDAIVCDMHCDTLMRCLGGYRLGDRNVEGHIDLPRLADGGVDLQFFACWPSPGYLPRGEGDIDSSAYRVRSMIDAFYSELKENPGTMGIALNDAQAAEIIGQGKIACVLAVEGGHAIENSLEILREFHDKGVRYMTLTWNNSNDWADAAAQAGEGGPVHGGLTELGFEVVKTMNELGMIVDISHVAESTFWDVMDITQDPVIASHSCAHSLCPHYRNLNDRQLKAMAANNGVVGINFYTGYLDSTYAKTMEDVPRIYKAEFDSLEELYGGDRELLWRARRQIYSRATSGITVSLETLVDHIDHVAHVAGVNHVGLGSDFDGVGSLPEGMEDASDMPKITEILVDRGYTREEINKILGGNVMRVFAEVCGN
jgi:membrane dipeptidase